MNETHFEGKLDTVLPLKGRKIQIVAHFKSGCMHQSMQKQGVILFGKKLDTVLPLILRGTLKMILNYGDLLVS
jgi:hypothetical protein